MARVWVVNKGSHSYHRANTYGELRYITEGHLSIRGTDKLRDRIYSGLMEFTENDYLLLSGNIIPNSLAIHFVLRRFGSVKCLTWSNTDGRYHQTTIVDEP